MVSDIIDVEDDEELCEIAKGWENVEEIESSASVVGEEEEEGGGNV